jgi:hypothetical protein
MINKREMNMRMLMGSTSTLWKLVPNADCILETSVITMDVNSPLFERSKNDKERLWK